MQLWRVFFLFKLLLARVNLIWPCIVISSHTCNNIILSLLTHSTCLMYKFKAAILAKHLSIVSLPNGPFQCETLSACEIQSDLRAFICPGGECFEVSKDLFTPIKCFFSLFTSSDWSSIHTSKQSGSSQHTTQWSLWAISRNNSVLVCVNKMWHHVQTLSSC